MSDDPVLEELARRGDLTVVRSSILGGLLGGIGLRRDVDGRPVGPAMAFDADEWRWLLICAAPVALRTLELAEAGRERRDREERAMVDEQGQAAMRLDDERAVMS